MLFGAVGAPVAQAIVNVLTGLGHARLTRLPVDLSATFVADFCIFVAYDVASERVGGATAAKAWFRQRVVSENGNRPTLAALVIRTLAQGWDAALFGLVAYRRMTRSTRNQRWGDAWARTVVVRADSLSLEERGNRIQLAVGVICGCVAAIAVYCAAVMIEWWI